MYVRRKKRRAGRYRGRAVLRILVFVMILCSVMNGGGRLVRWLGSLAYGSWAEGVILLSGEDLPDSLRRLAEDNPETLQFVRDYPRKKDERQKIDISGDLDGTIPLFLQWDERWGYRDYGDDFMALNGCGPTCLSMVCCGLTGSKKWDPYRVAVMAEKRGYYVEGAGSSWSLMTEGAGRLGLRALDVPFDEEHILSILGQGKPVICVVGPGDFTTQGHFLVLTGTDPDGRIRLHDPNSRKRSDKSWELDRLMSQIRCLWAYERDE